MNLSHLAKSVRTKLPGPGTGPLLRFFLLALTIVELFLLVIAGMGKWEPWLVVTLLLFGGGMFVYVVERVARLADKHPENLMLLPVSDTQYLEIFRERLKGDSNIGEIQLPEGVIDVDPRIVGPDATETGNPPALEEMTRDRQKLAARSVPALEDRQAGAGTLVAGEARPEGAAAETGTTEGPTQLVDCTRGEPEDKEDAPGSDGGGQESNAESGPSPRDDAPTPRGE